MNVVNRGTSKYSTVPHRLTIKINYIIIIHTPLSKDVWCTKDLLNINKFWFEIPLSSWLPLREDTKECALLSHKAQSAFGTVTSFTGNSYELCQPRQLRVTMLCIKGIGLKTSKERNDTLLHNISTFVVTKEFICVTIFIQNWRL